ncbi:MAG TPA: outer membrane protein assembly factor BamA [Smithellaceae bacterium]|nr:outer membrane protein assembly factor BamA [Smithellaceae bacterium]
MTSNKKVFLLLATLMVFVSCMITKAAADDVKKISILPFDVHSSVEGNVLQTSVYNQLAAELRKEKKLEVVDPGRLFQSGEAVTKEKVLDIGKKLGASYIVTGSIIQFGDTINIDARMYDIAAAAMLSSVSVQGKRSAGIAPLANVLTGEILSYTGLVDKILRVDVAGNRKIGAAAITQNLRSKSGKPLSEADITADIKTIFKMGYFLDVSASVTAEAKGKVITFTVTEKGLISEIRITGNKALDRDDILGAMSVKARQNLNREKIKEDIQKIKALYDTKGYYNAEITDRIESDKQKDFVVILEIKENDRVYIRSIAFEGNEAFTQKELVNMMTTTERTLLGFITDTGILNREHLKQDVQKLSAYYFNNGFVNSQIGEPVITYDAKGIYIKIAVREGKRFKIGTVNISGDELAKTRKDLFAALKTKAGKHYDREAIMKDMEMITLSANDEGYAHADVNPQIKTHEKEQLVDVDFLLNKGSLVYIARIGISGNTTTRDKVIRRQLSISEGELYSSSKLKNSYTGLNQLRYFEEVDIQTEKAPDSKMDINIRVKEKNTGMFMIGAGYSAVDQAVIMAQVVQQNFLGYGQVLSLKASLGSKTNNYELSFTEPWLFDLPLWCKADIWKYKKEYDSYTLDTKGAGLTLGYPIWDRITGYVGYKLSIDNIQDVNQDTATQYIKSQEGERTTSAVTLSLGYDSTNDSMFPSKGFKAGAFVQHAGMPLGGNSKFTKYGGNVSGYYSIYRDIVFGAKARIGYLQNNDESDDKIPIFERYVLGGINSIRGLRYVGPVNNSTSDVIGGTTMLVFSLELVFPLIKDAGMKGVVFYDAGNTWNGGYYLTDLRQTCGVGVRWYSPIGPLRLEYGYVLDRRGLNDDAIGRWEFTIGMFM